MKVYINEFDLAKPSPRQFKVPAYSDFAIGVKIVSDGVPVEADFTVTAGGQALEPEADKIAGFTVYNVQSFEAGAVKYTVTCNGQTFELTQITADSSVLDKISYVTKTEYAIAIGNIDDGVLSRADVSSVVEVASGALEGAFAGNTNLVNIGLPNMTDIGEDGMKNAYSGCTSLKTVDFSKLSAVGADGLDGTFSGCTSLEIVLFQSSTAVPSISENTFANTNDEFKVIVPDALYEDWIVAETWNGLSSHITKVSDYAAVMTNYGGYNNMDNN